MLVMLTNDALGGEQLAGGLRSALAVELIHTYSLIHDDLPCMDDDDTRRGKATVHKKFGEADALLAGNALLTDAFRLMTDDFSIWQDENFLSPQQKIAIIATIARAVGSKGMIRGQYLDLHVRLSRFQNRAGRNSSAQDRVSDRSRVCGRSDSQWSKERGNFMSRIHRAKNRIGFSNHRRP